MPSLPSLPPYRFQRLQVTDVPKIQALFDACPDYFLMIDGQPAAPGLAQEELFDLPPNKTLDDKFFLGILQEDGTLAGVLDVVRGYPTPDIWFIGLLLLHPALRGQGLGKAIHDATRDWADAKGIRTLRLGVIEENRKGLAFWIREGYREVERKPLNTGSHPHTVHVMQLSW